MTSSILPCYVFCICLLTTNENCQQIKIRNTNQLSWAINYMTSHIYAFLNPSLHLSQFWAWPLPPCQPWVMFLFFFSSWRRISQVGSLKERRDALSLKNCPLNLLPGSPPTRCNQITTFQDNSILVLSCCAGKLISVYSVFARLANRIQAIRPPPNTILYSYSHSLYCFHIPARYLYISNNTAASMF